MPTTETLNQSPTIGAIDNADFLWVWDDSSSALNKVTRLSLVGASILGGGTINLNGGTVTAPSGGGTLASLSIPLTAWTPAWSFSSSGSVNYGTRVGRYIVINDVVIAWGYITIASISSPSGDATITGLPVTTSAISGLFGMCSISYLSRWGTDMPNLRAYPITNGTSIIFQKNATNSTDTVLQGSDFAAIGNNIIFSAIYLRA